MAERFLRMTRKWLEGAAGLRLEAMTQTFTKSAGKRADELISGSLNKQEGDNENGKTGKHPVKEPDKGICNP